MSRFGTSQTRIILRIAMVVTALLSLTSPELARASKGGGHMLGIQLGTATTNQEHMNSLITLANTRAGGISTSQMNTAYEGSIQYGYRFSGSIFSLLLRPSFFYQASNGTGGGASYNYSVVGFNLFPIVRLYPLENNFMKFFMQLGLGYGRANGKIEEADASAAFVGDAFGTLSGLGAEFCITPSHCVTLEGNFRYMKMERNIASDVTGTFAAGSLTQAQKNMEVEIDDTDFSTRMSGLQFLLGYTFRF